MGRVLRQNLSHSQYVWFLLADLSKIYVDRQILSCLTQIQIFAEP